MFNEPQTSPPRILIAGIGNIFLGDDGFGVEVVRRLSERRLPETVRVTDFGIRSLDLASALVDSCDVAILVDATPRGGKPGTLYVLDINMENDGAPLAMQGHGMNPANVLSLVYLMGGRIGRVLLVGCEPTPFDSEHDVLEGLSPPLVTAVDQAADLIESLAGRLLTKGVNAPAKKLRR